MSGAARAVVKPVQQGLEKIGVIKEKQGASPLADLAKTAVSKAESSSGERDETLARRRARRGGRALLSEARLSPEQGVGQQTLGSTGMS